MAFITSAVAGVALTATTTGTTTDGENAKFSLGTTVMGTDNTMWVYVQAGEAITQYMAVAIDENFQMMKLTHALAAAGHKIGFAQVAFSDNDLGWVCISGTNISALLLINCAADVPLYTQATAGYLDDASVTSSVKLDGVVSVNTITASTSTEVIASWPRSATI